MHATKKPDAARLDEGVILVEVHTSEGALIGRVELPLEGGELKIVHRTARGGEKRYRSSVTRKGLQLTK